MSSTYQLIEDLFNLAQQLGFDSSEIKIHKKDDVVVRVSFWNSKHASIEAALSPEKYDVRMFHKQC